MPDRPRPQRPSPLEDVDRMLVDGSNLLHALRRGAATAPPATLVGRLRGVIEMPVRIELLFDGPPDRGLGHTRIASGITVRYSGRATADAVLARLVIEAEDPGRLLVVTDDIELRREIMRRGGHTASSQWLIGRLERSQLRAPNIAARQPIAPPQPPTEATGGSGRPTTPRPRTSAAGPPGRRPPSTTAAAAAQALRAEGGDPAKDADPANVGRDPRNSGGWQPGRGATAKKGNPRRAPKAGRSAQNPPRR